MKTPIFVAISLLLAGCGGMSGGSGQSIGSAPVTAPVVTTPGVASHPIVFMGDSITYLWNDSNWMTTPADLLSTHLPTAIDVGVSGQTCADMWERFQMDVLSRNPSVVVIMCGTNDIFHLQSIDTQSYLFQMVQAAEAAGAAVIVGVVPPDSYVPGSPDEQMHAQWNANVVAGAASYGYRLADYYSAMTLPDGSRNDTLFATASAHPVSAGYAVMWDVLAPVLARIAEQ